MRRAFTLVELLVVIGIMALIGALAAPAMLRASQRARISEAAGRIHQVWQQARHLSLVERPETSEDANGNGALDPGEDRNGNGLLDTSAQAWHYGIVLVQPADGPPWVGLIYGNRATAALAADPEGSLLARSAGQPVLRLVLPQGVRVATAAAWGAEPSVTPRVLAVYAQFATGFAISPAAVTAGSGASAGQVSFGTKTSAAAGYPGSVRLTDGERIVRLGLHEAGILTSEVD
jgi:prepilin-type N-terminal cleavage/methylation domain-containing protein